METFHNEEILHLNEVLQNHRVYQSVQTLDDLKCFMEHHIYSVWDYMSLIKFVQSEIAPTTIPWVPKSDPSVRRFINELVMEEESDETHIKGQFLSHFEFYQSAMSEIGADTSVSKLFIENVKHLGGSEALFTSDIPLPSKEFCMNTFETITNHKVHTAAASLALGREHLIPKMFQEILKNSNISELNAPIFHYYLKRHIELDGDSHAPLSLKLLCGLCNGDSIKINESKQAVISALKARLKFWDSVHHAILKPSKLSKTTLSL